MTDSTRYQRGVRSLALIACLVLGSSCSSEAGDLGLGDETEAGSVEACEPGGTPSLEIGTGELEFIPLVDGGELELVHGAQGGVHVLIALQAQHIAACEEVAGVIRGYLGDSPEGAPIGAAYPYLNMRCNSEADGLQSWNTFLIWDGTPEQLHLQTVHIVAEVTDTEGVVVTTSKNAIIHDPTLD